MEVKAVRGLGGQLALWVFWGYCLYFLWNLLYAVWMVRRIEPGVGPWVSAFSAELVLAVVGSILGAIAWYTRAANPDA